MYPMLNKQGLQSVSYQPVESCDDQQAQAAIPVDATSTVTQATDELDDSADNTDVLHLSEEFTSTISIDEAIEFLGYGRFQFQILCATGLSYAADGMQVILLSFLTPVLKELWELSNYQTASISSTLFVGATFGTLIWGPLADCVGRRPTFLLATIVITLASFGMATVTKDFGGVVVSAFGIGFGVGGLTIPFDILAEFLPTQQRGQKLLNINYAWTFGVLYVVVGAYVFLNNAHDQSPSWRQFTGWCSFPGFMSLIIGYIFIPESPRWLVSKGRLDEATTVLQRAASTNAYRNRYLYGGTREFLRQTKLRAEPEGRHVKISELLHPQWRGTTLRLWGAWFTFSFGYFGTLMVTTRVFSSVSDETSDTKFDFDAIFISSVAEFIGTTMAIVMIDRVGRIRSQVIFFILAGSVLFIFCLLAEWNAKRWVLLTLAFTSRIFEMSATCILWVATAEILNTEIRGAGHSSSNAFARIGAIFCPLLVQSSTSLIRVGITLCVFHVVTALCVSRLPETNGRTMGFGYSA